MADHIERAGDQAALMKRVISVLRFGVCRNVFLLSIRNDPLFVDNAFVAKEFRGAIDNAVHCMMSSSTEVKRCWGDDLPLLLQHLPGNVATPTAHIKSEFIMSADNFPSYFSEVRLGDPIFLDGNPLGLSAKRTYPKQNGHQSTLGLYCEWKPASWAKSTHPTAVSLEVSISALNRISQEWTDVIKKRKSAYLAGEDRGVPGLLRLRAAGGKA
jgi:hypothetical protein